VLVLSIHVLGSVDWEPEWLGLDKYQLIEFLSCSDLKVKDEVELWWATIKWLTTTVHDDRAKHLENNLRDVLHYIRFPMMTAEQIYSIENGQLAKDFPTLLQPYLMAAYKYHALPLSMRGSVAEFKVRTFLVPFLACRLKYSVVFFKCIELFSC